MKRLAKFSNTHNKYPEPKNGSKMKPLQKKVGKVQKLIKRVQTVKKAEEIKDSGWRIGRLSYYTV